MDRLDRVMMMRGRLERRAVPKRLQVVIDTSAWMGKHGAALRKAVEEWKREAEVKAWFRGRDWEFGGGAEGWWDGGVGAWAAAVSGPVDDGDREIVARACGVVGGRMEEGENLVWAGIEKKRGVR